MMKKRVILLLMVMVAALVMATGGAALAAGPNKEKASQEKAKDAAAKEENATKESEPKESAAKESETKAAPDSTSARAGSAAGAKITKTFKNETPIQIPIAGQASPYPSEIQVSGFPQGSKITDVNLTLHGFSHEFPLDVDVLLVGPTGKKRIVMSDAGGQRPVGPITLVLDDQASDRIPLDTLSGGSFKPTNSGGGDTFPSPAPAPGGKTSLSAFDGTNPNGTWKLFVFDDSLTEDSGSIQAWTLQITAR